ncbi:MAG TPA: peroxiredoxin [Caldimonas sp.]|jgi:peroxiredoxin|nr:peroxiredoxin [Caldimonas sp.]HEX4235800.1 peroxiredoxin [Caldimonas sp.]
MTLRNIASLFALLAATTAAFAALKAGDVAPAFTAPASFAGKPFTYSLQEGLAKGPVVVYFYPSAYTSGCNVQAHEFSTKADRFAAAGASVIGVSLDSIERLNAFSADPDYCAGKLAVASDGDGKIARSYGLKVSGAIRGATDTRGKDIDHGFAERTTFVVKPDGTVLAVVGGVSPEENVARALELVHKVAPAR